MLPYLRICFKQILFILYLNKMKTKQLYTTIISFLLIILSVHSLHQSETHLLHFNQIHFQSNNNTVSKQEVQQIIDSLNNQISITNSSILQLQAQKNGNYIQSSGKIQTCKNVPTQTISFIQHTIQNMKQDFTNLFFKADLYRQTSNDSIAFVADQKNIQTKITMLQQNSNFVSCPIQAESNQTQNIIVSSQNQDIADLSKHIFVSNLSPNPNWIFGNLTENQYQLNQYNLFLQNNIVLCPETTPFAAQNGQTCTKCQDNNYYNLQLYKCQTCSNGSKFNQQTHKCEVVSLNACESNKIYVQTTKKCECPANKPYFDGTNCISCYIPNFWNKDSNKCEQCLKGQYFSLSTGICQKCNNNIFSDAISCEQQCTLQNPYFDGESCIKCDQFYNVNTNRCQSCQQGTVFDQNKKVCIKSNIDQSKILDCQQGYIFNPSNSQCIKKQVCNCPQNYIFSDKSNKCQCSKETPYDNGKRCVQCNAPKYWNQSKKQCLSCQKNQYYDSSSKSCVTCPKQSPIIDINNKCKACDAGTFYNDLIKICQSSQHYCPKTFVWNNQKKKCVCPTDKPIQTDQGCSNKCSYPLIWSESLNQCTSQSQNNTTNIHICKFGQIYNQTQKNCICSPQNPFKTSQGCINCYAPMVWSQKDQRCIYNSNNINLCKSNYVFDSVLNICSCPQQQPFNNGNQCVSCYLPMYWSNTQKKCLNCPQSQFFNTFNRRCQYCPSQKPLLKDNVCVTCSVGTVYNSVSLKCQNLICKNGSFYSVERNECSCPTSQKPFYDGNICVECKSPKRWDIKTRSCVINLIPQQRPYISPVSISAIPISSSATFNSYVNHLKKLA